jgi:uncharacterized integral membrane protein (TIGR00697 family)
MNPIKNKRAIMQLTQSPKVQYKYLIFLIMLYMTIKLTTVVLIYKIITIGPFSASASTLIMPFWFVMGDVIAEVYGYKVARHVIWMALICQFIFAFACATLITLHAPSGWSHQEAYNQVLGKLPRVALASFLAIVSGAFINAYAISKWKILLRGKYFWLRSLVASSVGELVFTVVAYLTEFLGVTPLPDLLHLMIISYAIKLLLNPILVIPSSIAAFILKRLDNVDAYDFSTNFNPFKMSLEDGSSHLVSRQTDQLSMKNL